VIEQTYVRAASTRPPSLLRQGRDGTVREQRLYQLVRQPKPMLDRTFALDFFDAGVEAFAFTFG
jgi:hypothetical protein